jgi:hypothetical protein
MQCEVFVVRFGHRLIIHDYRKSSYSLLISIDAHVPRHSAGDGCGIAPQGFMDDDGLASWKAPHRTVKVVGEAHPTVLIHLAGFL